MQYNSTISNYENCYLHHFFYAPTYAVHKRYDVVVTAYKTDINGNGKTYSVTKTLPLYIGITPSGNDIGDITTEFNDVIEDN